MREESLDGVMVGGSVGGRVGSSADEIVRRMAGLWSEVLDRPEVGPDDEFLRLGGDSIAAVRILGRIEEQWGIELELVTFFDNPTVTRIAALVDRLRRGSGKPTAARD
jgi:acyl carrier protein